MGSNPIPSASLNTHPNQPAPLFRSVCLMSYNEDLAERLRAKLLSDKSITEKRMFGGVCFLHEGKMLCGILNDDIIVRVADSGALMTEPHVRPFDFGGRPMKGFLYVAPAGYETDQMLETWIGRCYTYVGTLTSKPSRRKSRRPPHPRAP